MSEQKKVILTNIFGILLITGFIQNVYTTGEDETKRLLSKHKPWDVDNLSPDDIRCYCDLPICVSTGYMCRTARSPLGGCFSEVRDTTDRTVSRHGCVELLQEENNRRLLCDNTPRKHTKHLTADENTNLLLLCCHDDMCNHVDGIEKQKKILIQTPFMINEKDTVIGARVLLNNNNGINPHLEKLQLEPLLPLLPLMASSSSSSSNITSYNNNNINNNNDNNELWFRVATIAVPICGAVILLALIASAIRMLKNDSIDGHHGTKLGNSISGSGGGSTQSGGCVGGLINTRMGYCSSNQRKINLDYESSSSVAAMDNMQNIKHTPLLTYNPNYNNINNHNHNNNNNNNNYNHHYNHDLFGNGFGTAGIDNNNRLSNNNIDYKNETQAKKNQLLSLEYSLLPQSCNDPSIKPINIDYVNNGIGGSGGGGGGGGSLSGGGGGGNFIASNRIGTRINDSIPSNGNSINANDMIGLGSNLYRNVNLSYNPAIRNQDFKNDKKVYEKEVLNPATYWAGNNNNNNNNLGI